MQKIEAARRNWAFEPPPLLAVLFVPALAAACAGPAAPLYDVLDEAQERVDRVLAALEETEDEMNEATGTELPPCPSRYEPPPLSVYGEPAPYEDVVERPAELGDPAEERELMNRHARHCRESGPSLQEIPSIRQQARSAYSGFANYAQAMGDFIADDMTSEQIERLSAEVEAVAAARADEEDTLRQRYERLNDWLIRRSPLVREMSQVESRRRFEFRVRIGAYLRPSLVGEMSLVAGLRGTGFMPAMLPNAQQIEGLPEMVAEWRTIIEKHSDAHEFFRIRNDYQRRIHEGPDAVNPDEAAANWTPLAGVWTGEYGTNPRQIRPVEITFNGDGAAISYPETNCHGTLQLVSTSGAFGRVTEYNETLTGRRCITGAIVMLERTAENRVRFHFRRWAQDYEGNLTQQ